MIREGEEQRANLNEAIDYVQSFCSELQVVGARPDLISALTQVLDAARKSGQVKNAIAKFKERLSIMEAAMEEPHGPINPSWITNPRGLER